MAGLSSRWSRTAGSRESQLAMTNPEAANTATTAQEAVTTWCLAGGSGWLEGLFVGRFEGWLESIRSMVLVWCIEG